MKNLHQKALADFLGEPPRELGKPITPAMARAIHEDGFWPIFRCMFTKKPSNANLQLALNGTVVLAEFVMANTKLLDPEGPPFSKASVVFDFEGELSRDELKDLAVRVLELQDVRGGYPPSIKTLVQRLKTCSEPEGEILHIDPEWAGAAECYYSSPWILREILPEPALDTDWSLPCLVLFGKKNRIEHCPDSWFNLDLEVSPYTRKPYSSGKPDVKKRKPGGKKNR